MIRSAEHLEILNAIARIASADLELRPMLQRITDAVRRSFDCDYASCLSVDHARGRYVCEALSTDLPTDVHVGFARPIGTGVVGEVALTGRPVLLDDVGEHAGYVQSQAGTRSELCVPVLHRGETVAILNLESQQPGAFRGRLRLMETIAEQVAGAIASARLHQELQRRATLLEMVGEVSKVATDAGELDLLLDHVVAYIHSRFPLQLVSILLMDPEKGEFTQSAHAGPVNLDVIRGARWPVMRGVAGRALRMCEPQLVADVRADPDYLPAGEGVVSEYAVPIVFRGEAVGVLNLESDSLDVFTPENQTVFRTFADQLAGAIHMASVNQELEEANDLLREANQRLERLSQLDGLTGIANRRAFDDVLEMERRRAGRAGAPLSLLMVDIDRFKDYNDHYGHQRGDDTLRAVAAALAESLQRAGDFVARYGGEEFAVLLPGLDAAAAAEFAETLRVRVEQLGIPHETSSVAPVVTISVGVGTALPEKDPASAELVHQADRALYAAKREGRNRVSAAPPSSTSTSG